MLTSQYLDGGEKKAETKCNSRVQQLSADIKQVFIKVRFTLSSNKDRTAWCSDETLNLKNTFASHL